MDTRRGRHGLTLLELVVVIVLLGLAAALVAPSLVPARSAPDDAIQRAIDEARRVAVRRAESVTLSLGPDGGWVVRISPLGGCTLDQGRASEPALTIDPVRCRLGPR